MAIKILIIDDNEGDIRLIQESLKDAGIESEFHSATTGEDGLEKVQNIQPDMVLLDTRLPGIDGFQTCRKIKDMSLANIKVVIMTGVVDAIDATEAREAGADDYTVKTSDCELLIKTIQGLV